MVLVVDSMHDMRQAAAILRALATSEPAAPALRKLLLGQPTTDTAGSGSGHEAQHFGLGIMATWSCQDTSQLLKEMVGWWGITA